MDLKNAFGYDQVDNAWAAKNILVNHWFPLIGMVAKENSNIYIGPVYYYMLAVAYWIFRLNPIASSVFAGVCSIFTFWVIFYVAKKLFSTEVALIAVFINTFSLPAIFFDRVQWPVDLLPAIALLIFYVLYKIVIGDIKKIIPLALLVGFAFNLHFTAIFFPVIIILTLPLFPRSKETLKYIILSLPLFLVWLVPNVVYQVQQKSTGSNFTDYLQTYYHGFHLKRMIQITGDALIQFNTYLFSDKLFPFKVVLLPLFFIIYLFKALNTERKKFAYLVFLWFIVPWIIFATYSGEISDYYFVINRFIALLIIAYFLGRIWTIKNIIPKAIVLIVLVYIAFTNVMTYLPYHDVGLTKRWENTMQTINQGQRIEFQVGVPESYLYYYYMRQKGLNPYDVKK
jgi:4-amino-4-deoxy-L-arabinose transferase-like glycosyltransferase